MLLLCGLPRTASTTLTRLLGAGKNVAAAYDVGLSSLLPSVMEAAKNSGLSHYSPDVYERRLGQMLRGVFVGACGASGNKIAVIKERDALGLADAVGATPVLLVRDLRAIVVSLEKLAKKHPHTNSFMPSAPIGKRVQGYFDPNAHFLGRNIAIVKEHLRKTKALYHLRAEDYSVNPKAAVSFLETIVGREFCVPDEAYSSIPMLDEPNYSASLPYGDHGHSGSAMMPMPMYSADKHQDYLPQDIADAIVADNSWFYDAFYKGDV